MAIRRDDNKYTRLSLQQYNGQARDGEIVIDLDTYTVWVGDASGALLPVSGGGNLANATIGNLTVTGTSNLGDIGNITILGGTAGQVLTTDGTGNLTWGPGGGSSYSNANVAAYLPTYTGNLVSLTGDVITTANVTANYFIGNGSLLTGMYSNANVANYLPGYTGNLNSVGNITSTGNITAYDITGTGTVNANALTVVNNSTFGGNITAVGNIIGGNISTLGAVTASGNVTGGNLLTNGNLSVTGNAAVGSLDTNLITGTSLTLRTTGTNAGINLDPNGTGNVNVNNSVINNVLTPVQGSDAANKAYVDGVASGLQIKPFVNVTTTSTLPAYTYNNGASGVGATITATSPGVLFLQGLSVQAGWRVLVKDETGPNAPYNGIYDVTTAGAAGTAFVLTRSADDDTPVEAYSAYTFDENSNSGWVCLNTAVDSPITFGTTPIVFTQFSAAGAYVAGSGLSLAGQVFNVNVDGTTIHINGSNQVAVMPGAQLINPNIGNATGTSITMTGNVTAGNTNISGTSTSNAIVSNTSTVIGNSTVGGNLTVTGNTTTSNIAVSGAVTSNTVIANTSIVSGNSSVGGNLTVTGNTTTSNISVAGTVTSNIVIANTSTISGNSSVGNLTVVGTSNLGDVGNITILGGANGNVLTTDGNGVLSWGPGGGGAAISIPAIYFDVPADGNNQTFSNTFLSAYTSNTDISLFFNGSLLDSDFYTLSGDTITVTTPLNIGDSIDIIRQFASNVVVSTYGNTDVNAFLAAGLVGNIVPAGNNIASLGNATNQFKDLWISNATIYFDTVPLSSNNNTLTFAGEPLLVNNGNTNISTTGTIDVGGLISDGNVVANTGYFFIGDGGLLSNISGGGGGNYSNANVESYLPIYTGNLNSVDTIITTGNVTIGTGSYVIGDGSYLTNIPGAVAESPFYVQTSSFSALSGSRYGIDTTGGPITATLPATPIAGEAIFFADAGGAYATNNFTVARNGQTIMGSASDLTVSGTNQNFGLFYNGSTWRTY